jgi:hypothetical protein
VQQTQGTNVPKVGDKFWLSAKDKEFRCAYNGFGKKMEEPNGPDFVAIVSKVLELSVNGTRRDYVIYFEGIRPCFYLSDFKETCRPYVPE